MCSSDLWEKAEGPLAGPLVLHGLEFHWQDYRFSARRAYLDPDIRPLLGRRLRLDRFELEGARLQLAASEEPFELPRWPDVLPAIEMPLAIQADRIIIDGLAVHSGGEPVIDIRRLRGGIDIANGRLHAEHLEVDSDRGRFTVHGEAATVAVHLQVLGMQAAVGDVDAAAQAADVDHRLAAGMHGQPVDDDAVGLDGQRHLDGRQHVRPARQLEGFLACRQLQAGALQLEAVQAQAPAQQRADVRVQVGAARAEAVVLPVELQAVQHQRPGQRTFGLLPEIGRAHV